ncbi:MAG: CapA family protein [Bacillota bacterium]
MTKNKLVSFIMIYLMLIGTAVNSKADEQGRIKNSYLGGSYSLTDPSGDVYDITNGAIDNSKYDLKTVQQAVYNQDIGDHLVSKDGELIAITISAAGDVTMGRDDANGYENSFDHQFEMQNRDYKYFFRNVREIFEKDDLTIVNLETTLTDQNKKAIKKFTFKGDPAYTQILSEGSIEAVNIANNHIYDYLEKGYEDTLTNLEKAGIGYFGYEHQYIKEVKGIKIGLIGYKGWDNSDSGKNEIKKAMEKLKQADVQLIIVSFHWGQENAYYPNDVQKDLAQFVVDQGANLVLGHHPHVLQGISDRYKDGNEDNRPVKIIYSLGNFSFGGNRNPKDKDTMIYRHTFYFRNTELIEEEYEVIPASISSVKNRNNYQPTPLEGEEADQVLRKINKLRV